MSITTVQGVTNQIVVQERITTSEFLIQEIVESIEQRSVHVRVQLGPFVDETMPGGKILRRGASIRMINAWNGDDYDAVRDTWTNADLIAVVKSKLEQ